ncbi:MAG TPA: hypothetical protein VIM87_21825 [Chitinophaga sp.]|uniref:hypothetical protein n=1 Tax=Chitinophaga sp. TaxID=1869181 RepID=UPI002F91E342
MQRKGAGRGIEWPIIEAGTSSTPKNAKAFMNIILKMIMNAIPYGCKMPDHKTLQSTAPIN